MSEEDQRPSSPFHKDDPPAGKRVTTSVGKMNPESVCKWKVLNKMYNPDDPEWNKRWETAAKAKRWDDEKMDQKILSILETAYIEELAEEGRRSRECAELEKWHNTSVKRREQRYRATDPIKQFIKQNNLSIVHEAANPTPPDPLAIENPLSTDYHKRPKHKRSKSSTESPPPDPVLEKKAADAGIMIVSPHKEKRKGGVAASTLVNEAKEALSKIPADVAKELLQEAASKSTSSSSTLHPKEPRTKSKSPKKGGMTPEQVKQAIHAYYKKKLAAINAARQKKQHGTLNEASRNRLKGLAKSHYNEPADREVGFEGSALQPAWDDQFVNDYERHPDAEEGDVETESDEEE